MSSLHNTILNLPTSVPEMYAEPLLQTGVHAYKVGHRDARHAAAELALAADRRIEELEKALAGMLMNYEGLANQHGGFPQALWQRASELLGEQQ